MGLAFVPLYIHFLGMEAFGLIGVFTMLQTWLSLLDFGLTATLTREVAKPVEGSEAAERLWNVLRSVEVSVAAIAAITALALWAGSDWIASTWLQARQMPQTTVALACALMGAVAAMRFLENVYRGAVVGLQRQVVLNIAAGALAAVRGAGAGAVLAFLSPSIEAFFLWQAVVSVLSTAIFAAIVYRAMPVRTARPRFSLASLGSIGRFSAGTFGISVLGFMLSQTDKLVLSKMLTLEMFGQYALAATLAAYIRLLATSIDQATYPKYVELNQSGQLVELARYYHKSTQLSVVLMGGVGLCLGLFGQSFLFVWTQDASLARDVYPLLSLLLLGMVGNGLLNGPYYLQMSAGWTSMLFKVNAAMVVAFLPLIIWATRQYGALGAAATWAAVNIAYLLIVVVLMHRRILPGEMWRWYREDIALPLACAGLCGLAAREILPVPQTVAYSLVVLIVGSGVTLLAATLAASHTRHAFVRALGFVR